MRRRTLLRGAGVAGAGGLATLLGVRVASDPTDAQASTTLDVTGDRATVSAGGSVSAVWLDLDVDWSYSLPDGLQPSTVVVEIAAAEADGDLQVVESAESAELFAEADGSESISVDLLDAGVLDGDGLAPDSGERATDVTVESRLTVENADGEALATAEAADSATVTVEREVEIDAAEYGEVGGEGGFTVETTE